MSALATNPHPSLSKRLRKRIREFQARLRRRQTKATLIAITGSSAKSTTALLLTHILEDQKNVVSQALKSNGFRDAVHTLRRLKRSDRFVVLEQGTEAPGQLPRAAQLIQPDIAIVTLVAVEHYTAFRTIEAVAEEKAAFVKSLTTKGLALLNFDDPNCYAMAALTDARCIFWGTNGGDYQATELKTTPEGCLEFTLVYAGTSLKLRTQLMGKHNSLSATAAAACALELGVPPEVVARKTASFLPVEGRMSVHVAKGQTFILDTAKAPWHSINLPIETLRDIVATRKRFVLGQLSDYRGNSDKKYRDTYRAAAEVADEVCFVGPSTNKVRASQDDIESGKFRAFSSVESLAQHLRDTAQDGEVIVVKSSRSLHLERLMLNGINPVRCWSNQCGSRLSCFDCGLFGAPFAEHSGKPIPKPTRWPRSLQSVL